MLYAILQILFGALAVAGVYWLTGPAWTALIVGAVGLVLCTIAELGARPAVPTGGDQ
jgi:hypothetical protein